MTALEQRTPILAAHGVSKRYGSVIALEAVAFEAYFGEVVALIGDNGAGKSTLVKILSGAIRPDGGTLMMRGRQVDFHSPHDARVAGIETVYQDLALAPDLDVASNLFLGREIKRSGILGMLDFYNQGAMRVEAEKHLKALNVTTLRSVRQTVDTLSGGQRQSVAVARAVFWSKDVVILDEPTAALGVAQSTMVLQLIRRVRDQGTAVIFVSHNMPHVFQVADRVVVMRRGRCAGTLNPAESTMDQAVSMMTGAAAEGMLVSN